MKLSIISEGTAKKSSKREVFIQKQRFKWERYWLHDRPAISPLENMRLKRVKLLLFQSNKLKTDHSILDIGCGAAAISKELHQNGFNVTLLDISHNRLKQADISHIPSIQEPFPYLKVRDYAFDGIFFIDLIAEMGEGLYRYAFSELARISKKNGWILCSTPLEIGSYDAALRFLELVQTEYKVVQYIISYHRFFHFLFSLISLPDYYSKARNDPEFFQDELSFKPRGKRALFYFFAKIIPSFLWRCLRFLFSPIKKIFYFNAIIRALETFSRFLWGEEGATHIIVLGEKKDLLER